ncbi:MAG TPA: hypothetical protein PKV03_11445 [Methylotenera sp.]|nr:hypothetical protein [Methylotenera sp.]
MKKSIQLLRISTAIYFTSLLTIFSFTSSIEAKAEAKKIYKEMEFIQAFKGKDKQFVLQKLGQPMKKQSPTKPSNSESYVGKAVPASGEKQDVIEMWYYPNLVLYNSKDTFKKTELTFINDRCTNLTFVN